MAPPPDAARADRQRRTVFLAVALVLLVAAAGVAALDGKERPRSAPARKREASVPRITDTSTLAPGNGERRHTRSAPTRRRPAPRPALIFPSLTGEPPASVAASLAGSQRQAILASARKFVSAYLAYEAGHLAPRVRAAFTRTATKPFAASLLGRSAPLRGRPRVTGRVKSLELSDDSGGQAAGVDATVTNQGWVSGITVYLEHAGSRWLVTSVS